MSIDAALHPVDVAVAAVTPRPPRDEDLRRHAESVGAALQQSVQALIDRLVQDGLRDQKSMLGVLNLSQSATSRLVSSVRGNDPLATLCSIPGSEALRQMLRGAAAAGVDPALLAAIDQAVSRFEDFVDTVVGDHDTLKSVLRDWVQESRQGFELRHKAAAYKNISALRGVQAELVITAGILVPATADTHACLGLDAVLGCRRTRPSASLRLHGFALGASDGENTFTDLDGTPIRADAATLLTPFSTVDPRAVRTRRIGNAVATDVTELPLGRAAGAGADLVWAQWVRGVHRVRRGGGSATAGIGGQAEPSCETYVVDALLHDEVWPGAVPQLRMFDTVVRGVAHPDDPAREGDALDVLETVQFMGHGADAFRLPEMPRYTELIRHACQVAGIDPARLRGYRCKVRFPIYGSQIGLAFPLPD